MECEKLAIKLWMYSQCDMQDGYMQWPELPDMVVEYLDVVWCSSNIGLDGKEAVRETCNKTLIVWVS